MADSNTEDYRLLVVDVRKRPAVLISGNTDAGGLMRDTTNRGRLWAAAHAERAVLADDLAGLDDTQWALRSLCAQWSIEEVVAHLTAAASVGPLRWFASVLGARFDFNLHNDRRLAEHLGVTPAQTLQQFRNILSSTTSAPGPTAAWLGEVVVHCEDIRRPLGIIRAVPIEIVVAVATFYARRDFAVPSRSRIADLRVEATDSAFATGAGPLIQGTTLALTMVMAGRGTYCDELTGPGVATVRDRCSQ
jgi:uncharacterized protein (TIGR03083 family)